MVEQNKKIGITLGNPNSIAPEIIIKALNSMDLPENKVVLIGNRIIFDFYEKNLGLKIEKNYEIIEIPFDINDLKIGKDTKEAGEFSFKTIEKACELAKNGEIHSIVTAPVSKYGLHIAGHKYSGQTEIIEKFLAKPWQKAQMLFVLGDVRILLLTRHVALSEVPKLIKKDLIFSEIKSLTYSLKSKFKIDAPKLALCSLNPHAGENGLFGREEIEEYYPAIEELKKENILIEGPFPSDGLFANLAKTLKSSKIPDYDCYIASYHDQGLIPVKLLGMDNTVNTTIGLDVIRTSPAHGTAFDIAGKNMASYQSMACAIELALQVI